MDQPYVALIPRASSSKESADWLQDSLQVSLKNPAAVQGKYYSGKPPNSWSLRWQSSNGNEIYRGLAVLPFGNTTQKGIGLKSVQAKVKIFLEVFVVIWTWLICFSPICPPVTVSLFSCLKAALVNFWVPVVLIYRCAPSLPHVERIKHHAAHGAIKTLWLLQKKGNFWAQCHTAAVRATKKNATWNHHVRPFEKVKQSMWRLANMKIPHIHLKPEPVAKRANLNAL